MNTARCLVWKPGSISYARSMLRKNKAAVELRRPTFQKIGLSDFCRIVTIESLTDLLSKVQGLQGHVQPSILETIAVPVKV